MKCPICKKSSEKKYVPFCSFRCKQIDLFNWLNENYKIPSHEDLDSNNKKDS